jgi:moderate conductance mechanosensitive channel
VLVCALYMTLVVHGRRVGEALIRGRRVAGSVGAIRGALAHAWVPVGLILVAGLFLIFVAGLSLGLLSYYRAVSSTLGVLFVVLVLDGLAERVWYDDPPIGEPAPAAAKPLGARSIHRVARALIVFVAALILASIWIGAIDPSPAAASTAMHSAIVAIGTLFAAFIFWELARLAIDRNLTTKGNPAGLGPGADDDDEEIAPATRLQTVLPLLRATIAILIGAVAVLVALSELGVNTAPLIAGAGVFGLAVSFGSLVRDVISGVFYMWDDAFRVGEYIDTGRLKGTAPLKLQGIAEVVDSALVLRFKFTARPVKPSWVQREYMKRMYQVFAEKGIAFATAALTLQTVAGPESGQAPGARTEADIDILVGLSDRTGLHPRRRASTIDDNRKRRS